MKQKAVKVFIGYDPKEDENYKICVYSIRKHASIPVTIVPLVQKELRKKGVYTRDADEKASNEFSITRFLVPYLSRYKGYSLFMDCDMLITRDIKEVFDFSDKNHAVKIVKHDYIPKESVKMDGKVQAAYPRKNWSSFVLWNCGHELTKQLTRDIVNKSTPAFLHRFEYIPNENIGALPIEMNYLVGEYPVTEQLPFNLHYTLGSPQFTGYEQTDYADLWYQYRDEMKKQPKKNNNKSLVEEVKVKYVVDEVLEAERVKEGGCGC